MSTEIARNDADCCGIEAPTPGQPGRVPPAVSGEETVRGGEERRVYLALADLWRPATAREIADRARLETSKCSAQLARLTERGAVEVTGGSARRELYYVTERLYNIYYLMRRSRGPSPLIEALVRFMEGYYSPDELKKFGVRIAREASGFDGEAPGVYRIAFEKLVQLPLLDTHREELLSHAPAGLADHIDDLSPPSPRSLAARELFGKARALEEAGRLEDAIGAWDEFVRRFGVTAVEADLEPVALALIHKGSALDNRPERGMRNNPAPWLARRFGVR